MAFPLASCSCSPFLPSPRPYPLQLWIFFPRRTLERWANSPLRAGQLMRKQLSPERLLSEDALLNSCQLVQPPSGTLMVIAPVSQGS